MLRDVSGHFDADVLNQRWQMAASAPQSALGAGDSSATQQLKLSYINLTCETRQY